MMTGAEIQERRTRLGLSVSALAGVAGVDRSRIDLIEADAPSVRAATRLAVLIALDRLEQGLPEGARDVGDPAEPLIEFEVSAGGVSVVVKGPISEARTIEESATRLVTAMTSTDVQNYLNFLGQFLSRLPEAERRTIMDDLIHTMPNSAEGTQGQ